MAFTTAKIRFTLILYLLAMASLAGCGRVGESREASPPRESWDAIYLQSKRIGHAHQVDEPVVENGIQLVRSTSEVELVAQRFGDRSRLAVKAVSWETPDGKLVRFETENQMSGAVVRTTGRVQGNKLEMEVSQPSAGAAPTRQTIAWSPDYGGFNAVEQSLRRQPLKPGESRTIHSLEAMVNQIGTNELSARDWENTPVADSQRRLLRIDRVGQIAGTTLPSTIWVDEAGEIWKTRMETMQQETVRTTREEALRPLDEAAIDIGLTSVIHLKQPITHAHSTQEVHYRVEMTDGDPSQLFPASAGQVVRKIGPHTAELVVRAIRPRAGGPSGPEAPSETAKPADLESNSLIQSDDSRVQEMARDAAGNETDPWKVATRLESYVHRAVKNKNFSQALSSAAEVARSGEGDCTEHAVLLAAMARARGIPARVAMGLVYSDPAVFAFHMWTELYIGDRWIPLDATLGRGGIGGAHLKIAQSSLDGADHLASFLPVAQALGRLKIEVISSR